MAMPKGESVTHAGQGDAQVAGRRPGFDGGISEALVREFGGDPDLEQESDLEPLVFSDAGALL